MYFLVLKRNHPSFPCAPLYGGTSQAWLSEMVQDKCTKREAK